MRKLLLIAGAAMLVVAAPVVAEQGNSQNNGKSQAKGRSAVASTVRGDSVKRRAVRTVSDRGIIRTNNGRLYAFDARGSCPPGLAKKSNGCLPPGQAKKLYNVGQRYDRNFGDLWTYNQIPEYLRNRYTLDPTDRYYYRNGYVYQVDPTTMLVQQVISALLR